MAVLRGYSAQLQLAPDLGSEFKMRTIIIVYNHKTALVQWRTLTLSFLHICKIKVHNLILGDFTAEQKMMKDKLK